VNPRTWRTSITVAVLASLLIGVAALVVGIVDWHKVDDAKSSFNAALKVNAVNNAVPATTIATPTTGATVSGVLALDARPIGLSVKSVEFVANGGTAHDVNIGSASPTLIGWLLRWKSTNLPNGTYQISSVGYNANGRSSRSASITVTVKNF
jgi:thermitase